MTNSPGSNSSGELDILDVQEMEFGSDQTWLQTSESPKIDDSELRSWLNEGTWHAQNNPECRQNVNDIISFLDNLDLDTQKQKFDSRTFTRPKRRVLRPSLQSMMAHGLQHHNGGKTFTKYNRPGPMPTVTDGVVSQDRVPAPDATLILREGKSGDFDTDDDEGVFASNGVPHRHNETFRLDSGDMSDDMDSTVVLAGSNGPASYVVNKPITINLSEPANNLHNTFNKIGNVNHHRNDSLANMSPPSLVSSIAMDGSGNFNSATFSRQGSVSSQRGVPYKAQDEGNGDDHTAQNSLCSSMTTSILDEKEMSTSILSQAAFHDNDSLIGSLPPSMVNSIDLSLVNSTMFNNQSLQNSKRESMESSLINSGTFNTMLESTDEKLSSGKPKFQLRKSFLKPDPEDNFDRFLMLNAKCNTDDLRGLSAELLKATGRQQTYDNFNSTFKMDNEKENMNATFDKDESFLMGDGMSDSFLKDTGRESLNITYNKLPPNIQQRIPLTRNKQNDLNEQVLPNQVVSYPPNNKQIENNQNTYTRQLNGTYDAPPRESPKRNGTFRKLTPPSNRHLTRTLVNSDLINIGDVKAPEVEDVDSNKESYVVSDNLNSNQEAQDLRVEPSERRCWTPHRRKVEGRTMGGGSSDSLEQDDGSSEESSPLRSQETPAAQPPLNMDDLEHLAYEQEQKLYQVISTPISKAARPQTGSATMLFRQNALSPIHHPKGSVLSPSGSSTTSESPTEPRSSSMGSLNRQSPSHPSLSGPNSSMRQISSSVKRESSAPEINNMNTQASTRVPFMQKLGMNSPTHQRTSPTKTGVYGSDNGLYSGGRSVGSSPSKIGSARSGGQMLSSPSRTVQGLKQSQQLSGSSNDLRKRSGLPASKLRQYSSHKELNRITGPPRWSAAGTYGSLRPASRNSLHASNPVLCPAPLIRQASYTLLPKDVSSNLPGRRDFARPVAPPLHPSKEVTASAAAKPWLSSNLAPPTKVTNQYNLLSNPAGGLSYGQPLKAKHNIGTIQYGGQSRQSMAPPSSATISSNSQMKVPARQSMAPPQTNHTVKAVNNPTAAYQNGPSQRLPRPSGLPRPSSGIPRKPSLRPPSTYSLAPRAGDEASDCY